MPSQELFFAQPESYRNEVIGTPRQGGDRGRHRRLSWLKLLGDKGKFIGMHSRSVLPARPRSSKVTSISAITSKAVVDAVKAQL